MERGEQRGHTKISVITKRVHERVGAWRERVWREREGGQARVQRGGRVGECYETTPIFFSLLYFPLSRHVIIM